MEDKNNLIVYCEYDEGRIADVSLELLTKGRQLATRLGCRLEALVLGDKLEGPPFRERRCKSFPLKQALIHTDFREGSSFYQGLF